MTTSRRALLTTASLAATLAAAPAAAPAATEEFPAVLEAAGRRLVLNGTGARTWSPLGIEVYRAALYLETPTTDAAAILAAAGPRLIVARYRRAMPEAFRAWLRPIAAGAEERYLFLPAATELTGPGRPPALVPGAPAGRILLGAWIGPAAPTPALRRGLLGERP